MLHGLYAAEPKSLKKEAEAPKGPEISEEKVKKPAMKTIKGKTDLTTEKRPDYEALDNISSLFEPLDD